MAFTKKKFIDITGLSTFRNSLLGTSIEEANKTTENKTATIKAIAEYVDSEVNDLSSAVTTGLAEKVSSVSYDTSKKKLTYNKGGSVDIDIVSISTLKTDIGAMTGATSSNAGAMGLVPAPAKGKQTSFLRGDGTWAVPTDTNTTYTVASGDSNGQIKVTPSSGNAYNVSVKGLGSAAYTASSAYASASHNHDASYYLKTEIDTKLNGKSNTGHTHTIANITDLGKATSSSLGLVKSSTTGTTANRNYAVEVSSLDGTMKVNVPWTDNNVTSTASNTTKAYLVGSSSASTGTGTLIKDSGVYLDTTAGKLVATTFSGDLSGNASTSTNASYSAKIGSSSSHPAIGSESQPVYVNASGVITAGTALGTMAYEASENYLASSLKGAKNGVASLDASGKIPSSQLPSYVDDVLEYSAKSKFPSKGETGKIYVDTSSNLTYRWSGSAYVEISPSLALGETSSTAYAGDKGATLATNLSNHTGNTTVHITSSERTSWNGKENTSNKVKSWSSTTTDDHYPSEKLVKTALDGKYAKPSGGIPKSDLASAVQTSLGKADTALQIHQDISGKENTSNKVSSWSATTTDAHYPSEKLVKSALDGKASSTHSHTKAQITDFPSSMPASDVYSWAKAKTKPSYAWSEITDKPTSFTPSTHSHNYAGSASAGGSATSAEKLNTNAGSATEPVYFSKGVPVKTTYSLGTSVPANAVFTDTKVTSVANHYTPSADSSSALSVDASSTTSAVWNTTSLVTGVNISRDAKGHVTGLTVDSIRMPANPSTSDTKNTAGATDTSSKIYLIGATSQTDNPQTYSDNQVYATSGQLDANKVRVAEKVTLQYNSSTESLDFVFA